MNLKKRSGERGSTMIEFLFSCLIWLPVLMGTSVFGVNLVRGIQVSQLSRDTAHMLAYQIDFSSSQNTTLIQKMSSGVGIQQNGGNGAIVLSTITVATQGDCDAANMRTCPNLNKYVFTSIFVFGNQSFAHTQLGSPNPSYFTNGTALQPATYLSDATLVATNFSNLLTFAKDDSGNYVSGQYAYVSEVNLDSQALAWSSFSNTGSYARSIF